MASQAPFGLGLLRHAIETDKPRVEAESADNKATGKGKPNAGSLWRRCGNTALHKQDPWEDLVLCTEPELATEHVYDATTKAWKQVEVLIRIDYLNIIASGAMRECLRMKKIEYANDQLDWVQVRNQNVEEVIQGVGKTTARWLAKEIMPNSQETLRIGQLLDHFDKSPEYVTLKIQRTVHDKAKKQAALSTSKILHMRDNVLKSKWQHVNYMAKQYKEGVIEENIAHTTFRNDVVMQEFCKLLAYAYNRHTPCPPKQIDMLHVGLVELTSRSGKPLLAYESFIEGDYHKWNTNSGWKDVETVRHTPHAFSFFSFRYTKGRAIVVDVQGVRDLYTDPQVHSAEENPLYGEGDLGVRGMALFLGTFRYDLNPIVQYMGLCPFPLAPGEQKPPSQNELKRFQEGQAYLNGETWRRRQTGIERSRSIDSVPHYEDDNVLNSIDEDEVAAFLLEVSQRYNVLDIPENANTLVPATESIQAKVHSALAQLHNEEDERVSIGRQCSYQDANLFHLWLSAVGGNVESMIGIAKRLVDSDDSKRALQWYDLASRRGSRDSCVAAAEILISLPTIDDADNNTFGLDHTSLKLVEYYERALSTPDKYVNDQERKRNMSTCNYELYMLLGKLYNKNKLKDDACKHFQIAADLALEAGQFKLNAKLVEQIETIST